MGDAAWSLIAELNRDEVDEYLGNRRAHGFNALLVNLIEHKYATNAPRNIYGDAPFVGSFGQPNEAYFRHVDWVLERALANGFAVFLAPAYLGSGGNDGGWYREMGGIPHAKLRQYGRFLGRRYGRYPNLVWTFGGDFNPPIRDSTEAIIAGIREIAPNQLGTAHCAVETRARDFWGDVPWLDLDTVYTYRPAALAARHAYLSADWRPFFLVEGIYEDENGFALDVRRQSYSIFLNGGVGAIFGNNPIWHFSGPGLGKPRVEWRTALDRPGSQSMTLLAALMSSLRWPQLRPDLKGDLIQLPNTYLGISTPLAAISADQTLAIAYAPFGGRIPVSLSTLRGRSVSGFWYDPTNGTRVNIPAAALDTDSQIRLKVPGPNSRFEPDWVLVLQSATEKASADGQRHAGE